MNSPIPKARQTDREATMSEQQALSEREAARGNFETWAIKNGYSTAYSPNAECGVEGGPVYADCRTHAAWWAYRAALSAPPPQEVGWQPIETAPEDGEFLAFKPSIKAFTAVILTSDDLDCEYDGGVHCSWDHSYVEGVTHWMPLPSAPKEQAAPPVFQAMGLPELPPLPGKEQAA